MTNIVKFPLDKLELSLAKRKAKEFRVDILSEDAIGKLSEWFTSHKIVLSNNELTFLQNKIKQVLEQKV